MIKGILLASYVESISTRKDKSVKIVLGTQELSQGNAGELFSLQNKIVACYISPKETIDQKEMDQVDKVDPEFQGKSQSQRIRNTLFRVFEKNPEGHKEFDSFYKAKTELYIEHLKSRIDQ